MDKDHVYGLAKVFDGLVDLGKSCVVALSAVLHTSGDKLNASGSANLRHGGQHELGTVIVITYLPKHCCFLLQQSLLDIGTMAERHHPARVGSVASAGEKRAPFRI